ncbi:uncharacterized protein LOC141909562 isoform X2 [Tubulanus polymorphus]|uniref:uncharacterized protein LOC141909562 isoform X2 n=2 Tax=Tubulanus polymorphus TaxID=672921 RepID=UPI003DA6B4A1
MASCSPRDPDLSLEPYRLPALRLKDRMTIAKSGDSRMTGITSSGGFGSSHRGGDETFIDTKPAKIRRIILHDVCGRRLDTDTSYQRAIYRAKQKIRDGEMEKSRMKPEEWRLPKAPLPARPDLTRIAPIPAQPHLRHSQLYPFHSNQKQPEFISSFLPFSTLMELCKEEARFILQSNDDQLFNPPNLPIQLPIPEDTVRLLGGIGSRIYVPFVGAAYMHGKPLVAVEPRQPNRPHPGLCNGCRRAGLCLGCAKSSFPHYHKGVVNRPIRTGGGYTFFKRGMTSSSTTDEHQSTSRKYGTPVHIRADIPLQTLYDADYKTLDKYNLAVDISQSPSFPFARQPSAIVGPLDPALADMAQRRAAQRGVSPGGSPPVELDLEERLLREYLATQDFSRGATNNLMLARFLNQQCDMCTTPSINNSRHQLDACIKQAISGIARDQQPRSDKRAPIILPPIPTKVLSMDDNFFVTLKATTRSQSDVEPGSSVQQQIPSLDDEAVRQAAVEDGDTALGGSAEEGKPLDGDQPIDGASEVDDAPLSSRLSHASMIHYLCSRCGSAYSYDSWVYRDRAAGGGAAIDLGWEYESLLGDEEPWPVGLVESLTEDQWTYAFSSRESTSRLTKSEEATMESEAGIQEQVRREAMYSLYQVPAPFRVMPTEKPPTIAQDPFSKNRALKIPQYSKFSTQKPQGEAIYGKNPFGGDREFDLRREKMRDAQGRGDRKSRLPPIPAQEPYKRPTKKPAASEVSKKTRRKVDDSEEKDGAAVAKLKSSVQIPMDDEDRHRPSSTDSGVDTSATEATARDKQLGLVLKPTEETSDDETEAEDGSPGVRMTAADLLSQMKARPGVKTQATPSGADKSVSSSELIASSNEIIVDKKPKRTKDKEQTMKKKQTTKDKKPTGKRKNKNKKKGGAKTAAGEDEVSMMEMIEADQEKTRGGVGDDVKPGEAEGSDICSDDYSGDEDFEFRDAKSEDEMSFYFPTPTPSSERDGYSPAAGYGVPPLPEIVIKSPEKSHVSDKSRRSGIEGLPDIKQQPRTKKRKPPPKVRKKAREAPEYKRKRRPRPVLNPQAPSVDEELSVAADPLDYLAKYCIIHPDRLPFYERIFDAIISKQTPKFPDIVTSEQQTVALAESRPPGGRLTQHEYSMMRDMTVLTRAPRDRNLVQMAGEGPTDRQIEKLLYTIHDFHDKYETLEKQLNEKQDRRLTILSSLARRDFPDLTKTEFDSGKRGKKRESSNKNGNAVKNGNSEDESLETEDSGTVWKNRPPLADQDIVNRLDQKKLKLLSSDPDVALLDLEISRIRHKLNEIDKRIDHLEDQRTLLNLYAREIHQQEQTYGIRDEYKRKQSLLFQTLHPQPDYEMNLSELEEALKIINHNLITENELKFVIHILQIPGRHRINVKLFSAVAALSERVAQLDPIIKKLINKLDFEALDVKMERCKELFFLLDQEDVEVAPGKVAARSLGVELAAGGLSSDHTKYVVNKLNRETKGEVDFVDFLTYVPLFIEIHDRIISDPLSEYRNF